jgi:hypothetical protein
MNGIMIGTDWAHRYAVVVELQADTHGLDLLVVLGLARDRVLPKVAAVGDVGEALSSRPVQLAALVHVGRRDDLLAQLRLVLHEPAERADDADPHRAVVLDVLEANGRPRLPEVANARLRQWQLLHLLGVGVLLLLGAQPVEWILERSEDGIQLRLCTRSKERQQLQPERVELVCPHRSERRL